MLLLWCLSMIQFSPSHLGEEVFFSLLISIQSTVSVVAEFRLYFEKFSISPLQAYYFRCWFSNNSVTTFLEGCFPSSFVAEVGIFFSSMLFQWSIFYSFFRRHCDVALLSHHLELWGSCSFRAYPFNRSVMFSAKFFASYQVSHLFSTGVLSEFFILIPCPANFNRSGLEAYLVP